MHPYYTTSFADREMFAYNKQQAELKRVLAQPEQRMKYAFEFLSDYVNNDELMAAKCYDAIAKYSAQLDYSEAHF
jgi:glucan phosphorylase